MPSRRGRRTHNAFARRDHEGLIERADTLRVAHDLHRTDGMPMPYGPYGSPGSQWSTSPQMREELEPVVLPERSYVYFLQAEAGGPIKIGKTKDPRRRLAAHQSSCPLPLRMLAIMPGGWEDEQRLHLLFRDYRVHREWFLPDAPGLQEAIEDANRKLIEAAERRLKRRARLAAAQAEKEAAKAAWQTTAPAATFSHAS